MGYTTYTKMPKFTAKDAEGYKQALPILQKIAEKYKNIIQYECETEEPAQVNEAGVHFNGLGEDGHETFTFEPKQFEFEFCKTARKAYDLPVCEMLLVLKAYLPSLELSSDGFSGYAKDPKIDGFWGTAINNVKEYGIHYTVKVTSQGPGREEYVNITPVFDKFINAVAVGMEPAKKAKWEYSKLGKSLAGWREDIREQLRAIGPENIKRIKCRNAGYVNGEYYAMLYSGEQIPLGVKA